MSIEKVKQLAAVQGVPVDAVAEYLRMALMTGENVIPVLGVKLPYAAAYQLYADLNGLRN